MTWELKRFPDEWDSFHLEVRDERRVLAAITQVSARLGMQPVNPDELLTFGRWLHEDDDPSCRRFLVSPPNPRWTSLLISTPDWYLDWCSALSAGLGCRSAYLTLADADVFTLQLFDGPAHVAGYVSSPCYYDLPPREPGDLGVDLDAVLAFCKEGTSLAELREALAPPGPIDVDGALAFRRMTELLNLPSLPATSYRDAMESDAKTLRPEVRDWPHLTFRESREEADDEASPPPETPAPRPPSPEIHADGGVLLPFRRPPKA